MATEKKIQLKIVSPEKIILEKEIYQVTLPVIGGIVTILPNHRSYIGALKVGEMIIKNEGQEDNFVVMGGMVEFNNNEMIILADEAEPAGEIDLEKAEAARKRAQEVMKQKHTMSEMEYAVVAADLERQLLRVKVGRKHRMRR